ncbi:leucine-rich repeat domain-containing protein [Kordia sp.]|uniref:leucine-rich repeat domain-containing protein n=1 Tax=Kordia sp. TaxID=1965332 RepID=UPI003D6B5F61
MKQKLLLTFLIINNILWANTEIAAPANDNFANAIPITCGNNYTASTVETTIDEDNAPDSVSPAVDLDAPNIWYSYTGSGIAEIVTLDLCASGYDTSYLVYTGTSGNLTLVAANDDNADQCGPGYRSYGTFESDGTTTYYITITGYGPASIGAVDLTVSCIPVGAEEIPDSNFEQALIDAGLDTGPVDGYIFPAALDQVTALNLSNKSISDLTGIEFFTSLQTLNCSNNNLTALDVSANTGITTLNCSYNSIATLNLINLPNLNLLLCNNNQLTMLNVKNGNNANFIAFSASGNSNLTCIEVDNPTYSTENWSSIDTGVTFEVFCDAVTYIPDNNFEQNLIDRGLDDVLDDYVVTANINTITAVDISNSNVADLTGIEDFTALRFLYAYGNQISSVDVTQNTALEVFEINGNNISTIDLTQNTALVDLQIWSNPITTIDLTQNVALEKANFQHCQLTAIDVSQNIALKELSVIFNTQISTINVSTNINLEELGLTSTQVSTLDLTNNPNLQELFLANCPIATVDISTNLALEFLNISGTQIQDINLSNHPAFDALFAENTTALTNINVQNGNNTNFRFFYTRNTPNLECVQVDDVAYSTTNWTFVDTGINFSTFCAAGVNDECVNAINIPISSVSCDNVVAATMQDATDSNSLHCFGDDANFSDVWFSFIATETSHVVKLQNLTGSPDFLWHTVIDAQTYNCGNITNAIYCTDALEDTATGLTVGNTYYVQVYSHEANANTIFDICVSPVVPANQVYVPDDNFEQALIDLGYDTVLDDLVLRANVNTVTTLDVVNKNIVDLTGIEAFAALEELYIDQNNISTTVNLTQNPLLKTFFAESNTMTTLDVTQNPLLETLYIAGNSLTTLDVTQNSLLKLLFVENNSLSSIDVTQNGALTHIAITGNNLSTLNVTQNPLLRYVSANNNSLTTIDLSQNPALEQAYFSSNQLTAIDVSQNTMLEDLGVFSNPQIPSIDVSNNPNLKTLNVSFTQVSTIDVSSNPDLERLSFVNCPVTEIDVTTNLALTHLSVAQSLVTSVDVSGNPVFESISCRNSPLLANLNMQNGNNANVSLFLATDTPNLSCIQVDNVAYSTANWTSVDTGVNFSTSCPTLVYVPDDNFEQALIDLGYDNTIDDYVLASNINTITSLSINDKNIADLTGIQGFTALEELYVFNNPLGSLNLTQNPALELLNANNTSLTTIDLTQNPALQFLSIESNSLTTIDITQNSALISASFQSNQLTAIDVSQNATLENLNLVQNTQLANLDVSANPNLITLNLNFTQISSLDVANNSNLETISAASCPITTLNVSNNLNLKILSLVGTPIKKIDVSNNPIFESLYVSNCSDLTGVNIQNGNNANIQFFFTISTPSLTCVQVDDVAYSTANWGNVDTGTNFSIDCGFLENDECVDAIDIPISNVLCNTTVAGTLLQASDSNVFQCFGNTDFSDVWYSFVATETTHNVKILNTSGSNSRVFHAVIDAQTYTCGNITDAIYCTDSTEGQATNLTIGNKYFVQVYTDVANSTETFDVCVSTTSSPGLTYVPDDNFEQALIDLGLDTVLDDYVVTSNINTVNDLNVRNLSIFDLTGIEDFAALEILNCGLNFLGELDLSNNTNLNYLIADNAALVGLNVKNGNNMNVTTFITLGNVDLFCVQVDDAAYSTTNWTIIEGTTSFSEFCGDPIQVAAKVYLQGAMLQHTDGSMRTDLNDNNLVSSISSPYTDGIGASDNVFLATGQDKVVDWIWIELRDATNPTTIIEGKSAILQRDGDIVDATADDASTPVSFNQDAGDYHIVIKHRNHLGIMSNSALALSTTVTAVDFTDGNNQITYGTNAQTTFGMPANSVAMWCGNVNGDNVVQYSGTNPDVPTILSTVLNNPDNFLNFPTYVVSGYDTNDVNMDGSVQYAGTNPDTPFILQNIFAHPGNFLNFSTYQITEQLPQSE